MLAAAIFALGFAIASISLPGSFGAAWGQTASTGKEAIQRIARTFGVKVLKTRSVTVNGRAAVEITVMNPGGNFNEAFQVYRLLVDAATGKLISGFGHGASAHRFSAPSPGEAGTAGEDVGSAARRLSTAK